jgi:hypothetical protein
MGRSFWILDDLGLLRQFEGSKTIFNLLSPEDAIIGNWGSQLNYSSTNFSGSDDSEGVNPANGVVFYYYIPDNLKNKELALEIKDENGNTVRTVSSKANPNYQRYPGGPSPEPILSNKAGLNRFVWDMRHQSLPGIPTAYIEGSYRGHKAMPNLYSASLKQEDKIAEVSYLEIHQFKLITEANLRDMHNRVNQLKKIQEQLIRVIKEFPQEEKYMALKTKGKNIIQQLKSWDEDMVQRKSKAYDDVENFPNKFSAEYIFLMNQNDSSIPKLNSASKNRLDELNKEWRILKSKSDKLIETIIPDYNKLLWDYGIGALNVE